MGALNPLQPVCASRPRLRCRPPHDLAVSQAGLDQLGIVFVLAVLGVRQHGVDVDDGGLAEFQRGFRAEPRRTAHTADPHRDHDLHPDRQLCDYGTRCRSWP